MGKLLLVFNFLALGLDKQKEDRPGEQIGIVERKRQEMKRRPGVPLAEDTVQGRRSSQP